MVDKTDQGRDFEKDDPLTPFNARKKPKRQTAVALRDAQTDSDLPTVTAAGRGKIAEKILQIAFDSGIRVREDSALAEILAAIELDSPIPSEAFMAVAEILGYVYRANGQPNPFDAVRQSAIDDNKEKEDTP